MLDDPKRDVVGFLTQLGYNHYTVQATKMIIRWKNIKMHNAIFSKYPILEKNSFSLIEKKMGVVVKTKIIVEGKIIEVFCTHLKHTCQKPSDFQNKQADNLVKLLPQENAILMGDFNSTPDSYPIKKIKDYMKNTDNDSKPTWSIYKDGCPVCNPDKLKFKLDYIFLSKNIKFTNFKAESSKASDHLPISVQIEI